MDMLCDLLKMVSDKDKEVSDAVAKLMPVYDTPEAALEDAKKIAMLKPGDIVYTSNDDNTALAPMVFVAIDDGKIFGLRMDNESRRLGTVAVSMHGVVVK